MMTPFTNLQKEKYTISIFIDGSYLFTLSGPFSIAYGGNGGVSIGTYAVSPTYEFGMFTNLQYSYSSRQGHHHGHETISSVVPGIGASFNKPNLEWFGNVIIDMGINYHYVLKYNPQYYFQEGYTGDEEFSRPFINNSGFPYSVSLTIRREF